MVKNQFRPDDRYEKRSWTRSVGPHMVVTDHVHKEYKGEAIVVCEDCNSTWLEGQSYPEQCYAKITPEIT